MNKFKSFLQSIIFLFVLCFPLKGVAQAVDALSDSLVYNIAMYQKLYNDYSTKKGLLQQDVIGIVKRELPYIASEVDLNAKFAALGLDSMTVVALAKTVSNEVGASISEDEVVNLSTVNDLFEAVYPKGDSIMLMMAYYPWKAAFSTHRVYRVGLYNDGVNILKGLIGYTCDSIQREIYINELMNVYDVWYEYVDTINASMNETFSKTMVKSDKVRDYIEMYPGEITKENVMHPHYVQMYDFIMDALNEPENQEEVHYLNVDKLMRISTQRLNRNWKKYKEQYVADFDLFDVRMQLLLEYVDNPTAKGNIVYLHKGHNDQFKKVIDLINPMEPNDCSDLEEYYALRMPEKGKDQMFLDQVIRKLRGCSDSEIYVEALMNYTSLSNVDPAEIITKRRLLADVYLTRGRYDDAIEQIQFLLGLKEGVESIEQAYLYYLWGNILERQGKFQYAALRYKSAVSLNPNFGNAYYRLAVAYAHPQNYHSSDKLKNSYKYLLCIDKLERAKECMQEYAGSATLGKYNSISINEIDQYIVSCKSYCPNQADAFMLGTEFSTPGKRFTFPAGAMKGETITIRFY